VSLVVDSIRAATHGGGGAGSFSYKLYESLTSDFADATVVADTGAILASSRPSGTLVSDFSIGPYECVPGRYYWVACFAAGTSLNQHLGQFASMFYSNDGGTSWTPATQWVLGWQLRSSGLGVLLDGAPSFDTFSFATDGIRAVGGIQIPDLPVGYYPADEAEDVETDIVFLLLHNTANANTIKIYFGDTFSGADYVGDATFVGGDVWMFETDGLTIEQSETYEWYAVAVYDGSTYDNFELESEHLTFSTTTIGNVLTSPVNPTPADTATDLSPSSLQLEWENFSTGPGVTFDVYLEENKIAADVPKGSATAFSTPATGLSYGNTYTWYVVAKRAGSTNTGATWTFTTTVLAGAPLPSGDSTVHQKRRLIAAADDRIWYEDI